jgi:RNA polymerase sigma-70 factor (ECF subfamily)
VGYLPASVEEVYFPYSELIGDIGPSLTLLADRIEGKLRADKARTEPVSVIDAAADDGILVASAKQGNTEAFAILVERHQQRIFACAMRITRNEQDAEDAVQLSLHKAFTHLPRFEGRSAFSTWLTRIAINEALMLRRKNRGLREISIDELQGSEEAARVPEIPDSSPGPESSYFQREQQELLSAAVGQLRPSMRQAIELRDLRELSVDETALITGLSIGAVKARLFHARRKLRDALRRNTQSAK